MAAAPIFLELLMKFFSNKYFKIVDGTAIVFASGCVALSYLLRNDVSFYRKYVFPIVKTVDPEAGHKTTISLLKYNTLPSKLKLNFMHNVLQTYFVHTGRVISSPLGLAAGFDKNACAVPACFKLGFSFVEIGSVTRQPQPGNPKPRVFRITLDEAVINRYGFNSDGYDSVYKRLVNLRSSRVDVFNDHRNLLNINFWSPPQVDDGKPNSARILGVNLGLNKNSASPVDDYVCGTEVFSDVADYIVINVSSPNTPGLRDLQLSSNLSKILKPVLEARSRAKKNLPILLKLSPDLSDPDLKDIVRLTQEPETRIDGYIISNTTIQRPNLSQDESEAGGLSGKPLHSLSTQMVGKVYQLTGGNSFIIGCGGVDSGQAAYEKIRAGANLVQLYTGLIYNGPALPDQIKQDLAQLLIRDGFTNVSQAVGVDNRI